MRWVGGFLLAGVMIGAGAWGLRPSAGAEPLPAPGAAGDPEWRGAASCAAAACHNGNGPKGTRGSEYTTWVTRDPHSRAYEILSGERSLRIEKNFKGLASTKEARPECNPLCLSCHVAPGFVPLSSKNPCDVHRRGAFSFEDGVSCEACHGPAGNWLTQHYTDAWRAKKPDDKVKAGMWDTKNLVARAEVCVTCHVGKGDLDVNHDLIAAGHPRLAFEYGAFLANMPRHWDHRKEVSNAPDFEARAWAVGQAVSARAELELLAHRADARNHKPWPEFAEYDCSACHHDLRDEPWRRAGGRAQGGLRALSWGGWYFSLLPEALAGTEQHRLQDRLTALRGEMKSPFPDRGQVVVQADNAAGAMSLLVGAAAGRRFTARELDDGLRHVAADEGGLAAANPDGATQVYLALAALCAARDDVDPRPQDTEVKARLRALARELELSGGQSFPTPGDGLHEFRPDEIRKSLGAIRQALQR